jgi:hypothetical protein
VYCYFFFSMAMFVASVIGLTLPVARFSRYLLSLLKAACPERPLMRCEPVEMYKHEPRSMVPLNPVYLIFLLTQHPLDRGILGHSTQKEILCMSAWLEQTRWQQNALMKPQENRTEILERSAKTRQTETTNTWKTKARILFCVYQAGLYSSNIL